MSLRLSLPVDAKGLAGARRGLTAWLEGESVAEDQIEDILIAANEAAMNAVEHSGSDVAAEISLTAALDGDRLELVVADQGVWREPVPRDDRGHGLGLMRKLMDDVTVDRGEAGTTVRLVTTITRGRSGVREPVPAAISVQSVDGVAVATLTGDVDLAAVPRMASALDDAAGSNLVVDLTGVGYLDSSGVHMLFKLARSRHAASGATRLVVSPGAVRRVLELTGVESMMEVHATVSDAVKRFG